MKAKHLLVLGAVALFGCDDKKSDAPAAAPHVHEHHAPHGGALEELGEETAHVELVLDPTSGRLTAFVLDGEAENPVRVVQPTLAFDFDGVGKVVLTGVANPLTGETVGDTSQFEGASEKLKGATKFTGKLETITARGVKFDGVAIGFPGGNEDAKAAK